MLVFMPVTLEELNKLSDDEITERINSKIAPNRDAHDFPSHISLEDFVGAQFYMAELDRREKQRADDKRDAIETKRWKTDLWYERGIVFLIVIEIILAIGLAIWGDRRQTQDVKQQLEAFGRMQTVLSHLEDSSKSTADAMKDIQTSMANMNASLAKQVELFYDVQINATYNEATKKLILTNTGRANVTLWSQAIGEENEKMLDYPKAVTVTPTATYEMPLVEIDVNQLNLAKNQVHIYKFTFFVKNEKQERFAISGDLIALWKNDVIGFNVQQHMTIPGWKK
jgi:hypothetical protein